ncbi:MAG: NTP transferase domain-containing protein [Gemmatimonadetes bacterium]|nr:NTP transferase domain-containing protein [Gemmatimonadota bacterium]
MKAIVLAGGEGTRLRPYTFTVPKPLLPLGDRPLLDYIIAHLARCQVTEIILALGYQAQLIRAYCGDGSRFGVRINYVEEARPLGTAGPLALCRPLLDPAEPCVLMNGDIVTRLDFGHMLRFHRDTGARLSIGYVHHTYQSPFGVLQLSGDEVTGIVEKPAYIHPVSAGIYCLSPAAVALVPADTVMTMPELAMRVREQGGKVAAYEIKEFWRALETQDHFEELLNDTETLKALQ